MTKRWFASLVQHRASATIAVMFTAMISGCGSFADFRDEHKGIQLEALKTAPGFKVAIYATGLPKARQMALGSSGTLFVGSNDGKVYALTTNGNQVWQTRTILSGITSPSGIAFYQGALYVSARTKVLRYNDIERHLDDPPAPATVIDGFPTQNDPVRTTCASGQMGNCIFPLAHRAIFAKPRMMNTARY